MWLFTTVGFFSIVTAEEFGEELQVRARCSEDLDRLRDVFTPGLGPSISKPGRDYSNYAANGGMQISRDNAIKGDIIQLDDPADTANYHYGMHTAVVVSHAGAVLKLRHLDLESAPARELGHPRVDLDPEHPAAGRLERAGRDAGTAAEVKHVRPGTGGDDPLHMAWG